MTESGTKDCAGIRYNAQCFFSSLLQNHKYHQKTANFSEKHTGFSCNIPYLQTEQFVVWWIWWAISWYSKKERGFLHAKLCNHHYTAVRQQRPGHWRCRSEKAGHSPIRQKCAGKRVRVDRQHTPFSGGIQQKRLWCLCEQTGNQRRAAQIHI